MSKMIQIRNVPDDVHRKLKVKAARLGISLSDYLLSEIEPLADLPTVAEIVERIAQRPAVRLEESPTQTIRRLRDDG